MRKLFTFLVAVFLTATLWAQSPEKMSYQAVIRNSSEALVTNTTVGMQISILQGSASGTAVYVETQSPTTNANGLISIKIGDGTVQSGDFTNIEWANGPYFIKTETDPAGGTDYTITGTSQLLSVPYALHAKTAESVSGTITETDPVFSAWDKSTGISITESQISDLNHFTNADETDPAYTADSSSIKEGVRSWNNSLAKKISPADTARWNNKLNSESDPEFTAWDKTTGISITESQITDLDHFTTADETDPVYGASVARRITGTDTTNWNNKLDSETDPVFSAWDKSSGISISESQIINFGNYVDVERDPQFNSSAAREISRSDINRWNSKLSSYNETDPVFSTWDKSTGISITESQISDLDHFTTADETDPVYGASVASGITATDTTSWNNKLDSETDPDFNASVASGITATDTTSWNNKLDSETDPVFSTWDKSTGISITESQISDLGNYIETETDPSVPIGTQIGEMQYWNGTAWVTVAATENEGATLQMIGGIPTWVGGTPPTPNVTNPTTGEIWMDRNLGASQVATSSTDANAYGDLYQWGRAADGHESRTSATTSTNATSAVPNDGNAWDGFFITEGSSPYDWLIPQDDNLWQGVSGTNNPCPSGYRLPTEAEWEAERTSWSSNNAAGAFASPLKLPVAGYRNVSDGSLYNVGSYCGYWSSAVDGTYSRLLGFHSSNALMDGSYRASGYSVRCLKD